MADAWFYSLNNERKGPVDLATLKLLISTGAVSGASLVWKKGMASWVAAATIDGLIGDEPPPIPQVASKAMAVATGPQVATRAPEETLKRPDPFMAVILLVASSAVLAVDAFFILIQSQIAGLLGLFTVGGFIAANVFSAIFVYRAWLLCSSNRFAPPRLKRPWDFCSSRFSISIGSSSASGAFQRTPSAR